MPFHENIFFIPIQQVAKIGIQYKMLFRKHQDSESAEYAEAIHEVRIYSYDSMSFNVRVMYFELSISIIIISTKKY